MKMELLGLENLRGKIIAKLQTAIDSKVNVGYTQEYAIYVHENLEAKHKVGQAKYLEQPAREMLPQLAMVVRDIMRRTTDLEKALLFAGLLLQRASQELVPVRYGDLKRSAFTRVEQ